MKKIIILSLCTFVLIAAVISCAGMKGISSTKEIPFTFQHGRIIIEAAINGETGKYVWDPTSDLSYLKDIDTNWIFHGRTRMIMAHGDSILYDRYVVNEMILGGIPVKAVSFAIKTNEYSQKSFEPYGLDGRLSNSVFSGYWCEISFSKKKIILHQKKPSNFTRSLPGTFDHNGTLTIPVDIEGERYGFFIFAEKEQIILPATVVKQKSPDEYKEFSSAAGAAWWVKTASISILEDNFTDKIVKADRLLSDGIALGEYGEHIGVVGWDILQHYDLLIDFTGMSLSSTGMSLSSADYPQDTQIYYSVWKTPEDQKKKFLTEYPGGELGAFAFIDPAGITLYLAEDSPLLSLGITANTVITHINGTPIRNMTETGMTPFSYQTVLTILDENKGEQEIALEQLRPR
jgi:hypothetical protein